MKRYSAREYILAFFIVSVSFAFGQHPARPLLDSAAKWYIKSPQQAGVFLRQAESLADHDSIRAVVALKSGVILNELSVYDSALIFFERAHTFYRSLGDSSGVAATFHQRGVTLDYKGIYRDAIRYYQRAYDMYRALGKVYEQASTLSNLGSMFVYTSDYTRALDLFLKGLELAEPLGDQKVLTNLYNNMGMVYDYTNDLEKALEYYHRAEQGYEQMNDVGGLAGTLNNIGLVYKNKGEPRRAIPYYDRALRIYEQKKSFYGVAILQNNLGVAYALNGETLRAIEFHRASLNTNRKISNQDGIANSNNSLGDCYVNLRQFLLAEKHYLEALEVARAIESDHRIAEALEGLMKVKEGMGDFKAAFRYSKEARVVRDSILSAEKFQKLYDMEEKYESELKEKKIALLNAESERQKLEIERQKDEIGEQRVQMLFLLSTWALIGVAVYLFYSRMKLKERSRLQQLQNEKDQAILKSIYEQRISISKDMHDEIGSGLTHIAMMSELLTLQKKPEGVVQSELMTIAETSRKLTQSMNEIIWAINPQNETLDNFIAYLREQSFKYFEPFAVRYTLEVLDEMPAVTLSNIQRRNLFLVIKETLNNALKHAHASCVKAIIHFNQGRIYVEIADNGRGIMFEGIRMSANGLKNMRSRMEEVKGTFDVSSSQEGTTIRLSMPLPV